MHHGLPDVKLDQFEGPYDLLIELAKKEQVKLSEISLRELTQSFIAYIEDAKIPAEIIASFIMVASTLLLIKARQVLPKLTPEEDEEVEGFEKRLALYEQYRNAGEQIGVLWNMYRLLPAHFFAEGEYKVSQENLPMPNISSNLLADAMRACIGKIPPPPQVRAHLTPHGRSLQELLSLFQKRLENTKKLIFQDTMRGSSKQETAVSFLAVLEMARNQEIVLEQREAFGTLTLHKL